MSILEQIYKAYCEGSLSIQPPEPSARDEVRLNELEKKLELTDEQTEYFEREFFKISTEMEKRMFKAGFKAALKLISE